MTHFLEELYMGNIRPAEDVSLHTPEYVQVKARYHDLLSRFFDELSESSKKNYLLQWKTRKMRLCPWNSKKFLRVDSSWARPLSWKYTTDKKKYAPKHSFGAYRVC